MIVDKEVYNQLVEERAAAYDRVQELQDRVKELEEINESHEKEIEYQHKAILKFVKIDKENAKLQSLIDELMVNLVEIGIYNREHIAKLSMW